MFSLFGYPENPSLEKQFAMWNFLHSLSCALPCKTCINECDSYVKTHPPPVDNAKKLYTNNKNVFFIKNWKKSISIVDIIVITTKWPEYKQLTSKKIIMKLKNKTIFDARKMFNKSNFSKINYLTIGSS